MSEPLEFPEGDPLGDTYLGPEGNETRFTTDPGNYDPLDWPKGYFEFHGIQGSYQRQEFDDVVTDWTIRAASDEASPIDFSVMKTLWGYFRAGGQYRFRDAYGNEADVTILEFRPRPRSGSLWDYAMTLRPESIVTVLGEVPA